ncbi:MAG: hypothetical protein IV100_12585 [Myxococcales bacterium]|uniref:hypothetical protein n=1 Tax=Sediminibacterium sp. TaxID=1917865 RepID=UPI001DFD2C4D|nr:hypothetical protein [Sediminibacterium sp.]MBT9485836.1 hypothetical protein [Sediminibacterium sp.]MBT9556863.1 hypothetical protein [Myxococcales bacterium]
MIGDCSAKLVELLTDAQIGALPGAAVFTDAAKWKGHRPVPAAAVLVGPHKLTPDGSVVRAGPNVGNTAYVVRRRTHHEALQMVVVVVAHSNAEAEQIVSRVTLALVPWKTADGDPIRTGRVLPGWLDSSEFSRQPGAFRASLLGGSTGVVVGFEFHGGLYCNDSRPIATDIRPEVSA